MVARFGWLWNPRLYAGIILGYLLGRALPGTQVAPAGIAFFVAVRGVGIPPAVSIPVAMAVVAGVVSQQDGQATFWIAAALVSSYVLASLLRVGRNGPAPIGAAAVAAVGALIPATMSTELSVLHMIFWCGLSGILALLFTLGIADGLSGKTFYLNPSDSPVPGIVILSTALLGLQGVGGIDTIALEDVAASVLVTASAYAGGAPLGAAAAAVLGITFLFGALGDQPALAGAITSSILLLPETKAMALVAGGLLGGTFRELGRVGVGVAFCLGLITFMSLRNTPDFPVMAYSAATGTLLFWALPSRWLSWLPTALRVRESVTEPSYPQPQALLDRIRGASRVLREVQRTFEQVAAVQAQEDETRPLRVHVADKVCRSCSMHRQCWETEVDRTSQLFDNLHALAESEGGIRVQPPPERLEHHCIRPAEVASAFNYLHDLQLSRRDWTRKLEEGRVIAGDYVKNIARVLDRLADDASAPESSRPAVPVLRIESGIAKLPKRGGHISGDSFAAAPLGDGRYLMALSDGMGVGRGAALESKHCVNLLHKMLEAGFSVDVAVNTVNSVLLLRSPDETFATVDLCVADLTTGRAEFVKVGAAPSFCKRGSDVTVIKVASVPVGIINQVQVEPEFRVLRPGDIIVMITDGIWDVSTEEVDKERWIVNHLARETSSQPSEIAESLLAKALEVMPQSGDDMTVLVARIDLVGSQFDPIPQRTARPTSSWAVARTAPRTKANASGAHDS